MKKILLIFMFLIFLVPGVYADTKQSVITIDNVDYPKDILEIIFFSLGCQLFSDGFKQIGEKDILYITDSKTFQEFEEVYFKIQDKDKKDGKSADFLYESMEYWHGIDELIEKNNEVVNFLSSDDSTTKTSELTEYWGSSFCPMAYGFFKGLLASKYWDFSK